MILFIHRKDLRTFDLPGFDWIRQQHQPSLHIMILDPKLLANDRKSTHSGRTFLKHVVALKQQYMDAGKELHILYGDPVDVVRALLDVHPIEQIVFHEDDTPYAMERDRGLASLANERKVGFRPFLDLPLMHPERFQRFAGKATPYQVFTPFYRKWLAYLEEDLAVPCGSGVSDLSTAPLASSWYESDLPSRFQIPFDLQEFKPFSETPATKLQRFFAKHLDEYALSRDFYAEDHGSGMSIFLNSGAISARQLYTEAMKQNAAVREAWIRQLAWRDFYLYQARMNADFFQIEQKFDLTLLEPSDPNRWYRAETGIPVIDAAMRQLLESGEMPNRLRMVTAMFFTKNMQCPLTWGEQFFRLHLADYDNILNRGGWLWSSSFGYDAAPYFRIMNPVSQSQRFDPSGSYLRRWLPELASRSDKEIHLPYGKPVVDLTASRALAIEKYKRIIGGTQHDRNDG